MKWLKKLLGFASPETAPENGHAATFGDEHVLKLRFYAENKWTLNGDTPTLGELPDIARTASGKGGCLWVWAQHDLTDSNQEVLRLLVKDVNMMLAFSDNENFEGMPLPQGADSSPLSNFYIYSEKEELEEYATNDSEFSTYLGNLQMLFVSYINTREKPAKADDGIFNVVGALRPHASKFWVIHPGVNDDEYYRPLIESLENQPLPRLNSGPLAFLMSNKVPIDPNESVEFEVVVPKEWIEVAESAGKDMSISEVIDTIWPA